MPPLIGAARRNFCLRRAEVSCRTTAVVSRATPGRPPSEEGPMLPSRGGRLAGKVVFVTGAARGQGRSHCVRMAAEGADVVAFDLCAGVERRAYIPSTNENDLAETGRLVEEAGGRCITVRGDVRSA